MPNFRNSNTVNRNLRLHSHCRDNTEILSRGWGYVNAVEKKSMMFTVDPTWTVGKTQDEKGRFHLVYNGAILFTLNASDDARQ